MECKTISRSQIRKAARANLKRIRHTAWRAGEVDAAYCKGYNDALAYLLALLEVPMNGERKL